MKVLIVDDSKAIFAMVSEILQNGGHDSVWAEDGLKAVECLKKNKDIELILLDWNMPNMDGLDFLKEYKKEKLGRAPVMMMTTENKPEKIQLALQNGAEEYVMKPFTSDILMNKIEFIFGDM